MIPPVSQLNRMVGLIAMSVFSVDLLLLFLPSFLWTAPVALLIILVVAQAVLSIMEEETPPPTSPPNEPPRS